MNTMLETMTPTHDGIYRRVVLSEKSFNSSVLYLEPGQSFDFHAEPTTDEHMIFVIQGRATVEVNGLNHVLNQEQAMLLPHSASVAIWNHGATLAKLLRTDVRLPAREPMIVTMPHA